MVRGTLQSKHITFERDSRVDFNTSGVDLRLIEVLKSDMGINYFFHMQSQVISHLSKATSRGQTGDVILCSPTGSGKTLAYALPIVQNLLGRTIPKLRAVVVVPTRDLATQVAGVFRALTKRFDRSVTVAVGNSSITAEARLISKSEILVATPGRLVDHIKNGESLILNHVRYLVLDESDRLLEDSYQDWINILVPALGAFNNDNLSPQNSSATNQVPISGLLALAIQPEISAKSSSTSSGTSQEQVWKILVSATQTKNPMRLYGLDLRHPTFFEPKAAVAVHEKNEEKDKNAPNSQYQVPSSMNERGLIVSDIQEKPLGLLNLLGWIQASDAVDGKKKLVQEIYNESGVKLVFTNSIDSSHRLCRLLELCACMLGKRGHVLEMTGELSAKRRKHVLELVGQATNNQRKEKWQKEGRFLLIVCSDVLARGMDIFDVDAVINYDAPIHINTYLHRAGRTARAGRSGTVYTLLIAKQVRHFRSMVYEADRGEKKVVTKDMKLALSEDNVMFRMLSYGLKSLRRVLMRENLGLLTRDEELPAYTLHELCQPEKDGAPSVLLDEYNETRTIDSAGPVDPYGTKRQRTGYEDADKGADVGRVSSDGLRTSEEEVEGDNLSGLLYSQVCRNWLSPIM